MELANSIITLQPGMYILRHPKTGLPPLSISRAAGNVAHNGRIEALYTPNTDGGVLREGRDCIVMQVLNSPVDLLVTAYLDAPGATVPALKVDKIAIDADSTLRKTVEIPPTGITLIGHLERVGDAVALGGERLGDPASNLRVEGFQVMWPDKPDGVELTYSGRTEGSGPTSTVSTGQFCGTRHAARRLVEVTFTLTGSRAAQYQLRGKVYFSGGFDAEIVSGCPVSGPASLEHVTALELAVTPAPHAATNNPWSPSLKTRVLRGKSKK